MPGDLLLIGAHRAAEAEALTAVLPEAQPIAAADLALCAVPYVIAPDRAAAIRLACRATEALRAFLPLRPMRRDETAARAWLAAEAARIGPALERFAGRVEWVISVDAPTPAKKTAENGHDGPGRAWLRARAVETQALRRAEAAALTTLTAVHARLAPHAEDAALHRRDGDRPGADLALLTRREAAEDFGALVEDALRDAPDARLLGPLPPYGFAGEALRCA